MITKFPTGLKRFISSHRLVIIIAGVVVIVGGYAIWSKLSWDGYESAYKNWHEQTKGQLRTALAIPSDQHDKKVQALLNIANNIREQQDTACETNGLIGWQRFVGALQEREKSCQKARDDLVSLGASLNAFTAYMADDQALAAILKRATTKSDLPESEWEAQVLVWKSIVDKIAGLKVASEFTPVKTKALGVTKQIYDSWQAVMAAHAAKDKTKYLQSQARLVQSYGAGSSIADASSEQVKELLEAVTAAQNSLNN